MRIVWSQQTNKNGDLNEVIVQWSVCLNTYRDLNKGAFFWYICSNKHIYLKKVISQWFVCSYKSGDLSKTSETTTNHYDYDQESKGAFWRSTSAAVEIKIESAQET